MLLFILRYPVFTTVIIFLLFVSTNTLYAQPVIAYDPVITSGLTQPTEVVTAPGDATGRLFIVEKAGIIRIWNGTTVLATPFLDISGSVINSGERGMLSMAFHPQYQANGFFFVYYNDVGTGNITLARYQVSADPNVADPTPNPLAPIISISKPTANHNGGHLQFKVEGGINYLYLATGDGGEPNDPNNRAQDPDESLGKIIKINTDNLAAPHEKWAWGLRNPYKWSFDRLNGDIFIGDVGEALKEEVDYRAGNTFGANYGWICFEANQPYSGAPPGIMCDTVDPVHVPPIFNYDNPVAGPSSVIGGFVYRGTEFPTLYGYYITVDFFLGDLWLIRNDGGGVWSVFPQTGLLNMMSSISETVDGSTLYVTRLTTGVVYKIVVAQPTPVLLTSFSGIARNGFNELRWTTESEQNIDRYIVEYSTDGRNFLPAGFRLSNNNNDRNTYTFRHNVAPEKLFYRLHIKEQSGKSEYSPVIAIGDKDLSRSSIYPTLVTNRKINVLAAQPVEKVQMISTDGRQVFSKMLNAQTGYFSLDLPDVAKGVYLIRLSGPNFTQTEKIIVQ